VISKKSVKGYRKNLYCQVSGSSPPFSFKREGFKKNFPQLSEFLGKINFDELVKSSI